MSIKISQRLQIMCQKFVSLFRFLFNSHLNFFLCSYFYQIVALKMRTANKLFARGFHSRTQHNSGVKLLFFSTCLLRNLWDFLQLMLVLFSRLFPESSSPGWVTFLATTTILWMPNNWHYSHEIITLSSPLECHKNTSFVIATKEIFELMMLSLYLVSNSLKFHIRHLIF